MGRKLKKRFSVNELMVLLCVLVLLASVAIPSYLHLKKQARMEQLMESAKAFKQELAGWIACNVHTAAHGSNQEPMIMSMDNGTGAPGIHTALKDYTRSHNQKNPNPVTQGPLVSVETRHTYPEYCPRDGKIHVIPLVNDEDTVYGAVLAVTNLEHRGGPKDDGLLATFRVLPDSEARVQPTAGRR